MKKKSRNVNHPFKWRHFEGDIILWLVRWYCRYALSYRDLKEMALERGLKVDHSTIYRWVQKYAPEISKRMKPYFRKTSDSWKLDETYIKVKGKWFYLYRAIDKHGDTLDWLLRRYRNKKSAKKFFKQVLNNTHVKNPRVINVDKYASFPPALQELKNLNEFPTHTKLRQVKYLNNSIENDHKSTKRTSRHRQWYQSFNTAAKTINGMESMRCLQKGQIRYVDKWDICAQNLFINKLFGLAV